MRNRRRQAVYIQEREVSCRQFTDSSTACLQCTMHSRAWSYSIHHAVQCLVWVSVLLLLGVSLLSEQL
jgi:hypothetical protein